jgi:hypothetical protein
MPNQKVRVVGSGFSTFLYRGKPLMWLEQLEDSGQRAFSDAGTAWQFIQPIGARTPVEIATSRVLQGGQLNLTIRELWNGPVWQQLSDLHNTNNIVEVFDALAADPSYVQCQTIIKPPNGAGRRRGKIYHNCVVVDISDNDTITVGGLAVTKGIVVAYTHSTKL